jgi:diaminopimelate epimerase
MDSPIPFYKYHALGNDYIVLNPAEVGNSLSLTRIQRICHRNYGIGSDGILLGPFEDSQGNLALRIFNPDGSEAEKSGNGLRIFTRYLRDKGFMRSDTVEINTAGGRVRAKIHAECNAITVDMGQVSFDSSKIPVTGPTREVIEEVIELEGQTFTYCAATVGNPHCVVLRSRVTAEEAKRWGPMIENDPRFPNRINVQFMKIWDRSNIQLEIWERGAGYTLASGSSSSAAAAVARRLGLCDADISVHMPGGSIDIEIAADYSIAMTGSVTKVAEGMVHPEIFDYSIEK